MKPWTFVAVVGLMFSLLGSEYAESLPYSFTEIGIIPTPGTVFPPAINQSGTVAFTISPVGPTGIGVFTGSGGPLTTIATSSGTFFPDARPSLNDSGAVAFRAALEGGGSGVFAGSGGPLTTIADTSGPFGFVGIYTSINDDGVGTFFATPRTGGQGIFVGSGGPVTTIADTSGPRFSGFPDADPAINNSGSVAFFATLTTGGFGIFVGDGGPVTTVADTSGPFSNFLTHPSINDVGMVSFRADLIGGGSGIFVGDGTTITTVADTSDPFSGFGFSSINNTGRVAFEGFGGPSLELQGIFTGPDPVADRVIAVGDELLGAAVRSVSFGPQGLNDAGQVAFLAGLADGRVVVVRAEPIPGTSTLALVGLGSLALLSYGWRRCLGLSRDGRLVYRSLPCDPVILPISRRSSLAGESAPSPGMAQVSASGPSTSSECVGGEGSARRLPAMTPRSLVR